jgi:dienelactone hydrolase
MQTMQWTRRYWIAAAAAPAAAAQTVHEEIRDLAAGAPLRMQFRGTTGDEVRSWQQRFRTRLKELLGPHDPPSRWETVEEARVETGDHTRLTLQLKAEGHRPLPVYLLKPGGPGKRGAVLALHGHGPHGHDAVAGLRTSSINYDYGLQLVRRGYVVAAPCLTPFGRRLDEPKAYGGGDPCAVTFVRMQLLGKVLMAENLRDVLWSLALLEQQPEVDPNRVGCVGLSYGGRMTMLAAAVSEKIRVAVISGALNVMQERITGRYSCGAQVIPGLLEVGDVPEIAGLIAPRPCLWEAGRRDSLMVKDWIEPALARIRRPYRAWGAERQLEVDSFDGGHQWHGVKAYPLLDRVLGEATATRQSQ